MALRGTFLNTRAGRRVFWTLLLAAAVPIVAFGVTLHAMLSDHFAAQAQRQQVQMIKLAGMGLLDRLLIARTALGLASRTGRIDTDPTVLNRRGRVLLQTAHVDAQGLVAEGASDLVQRWRESLVTWTGQAGEDAATLALGPMDRDSGARQVLMSMRRADRPGEVWIADIDTTFLFGELVSEDNQARVCVLESTGRLVSCPGRYVDATARRIAHEAGQGTWRLFLRSDFGIDDWTLVDVDGVDEPSAGPAGMPLARLAALGAAATLLFVGMLGMIQVRRTMVPLERLIAGTRRLAERDFAARVPVGHADEFGELARSFNHMAERIGTQVQALHVQSTIDREILNGLNVERVLQRVIERLEQLLPGSLAVVVEFDRALPMLARIHSAGSAPRPAAITRSDSVCIERLAPEDLSCEEPPGWLVRALPRPVAHLWVCCAKAGDELFGMLAVGTATPAIAPEACREIAELADRVSVTLASADRERRLLERATRDSLTGLANRAGLYECIEERLSAPAREPFTVMFIDLDRFKEVNDSMGHQVGDDLLRAVGRRLKQAVPEQTVVARPGGDEFVLVLGGSRATADALAPVLLAELTKPVLLGGRSLSALASIGMAHHPEHGLSSSDLMRRADMAMYEAKARGGRVAVWFDAALDQRVAQRALLLADLRQAMERNEFELHYQPRVDVRSQTVVGAEALLRWRHAQHGSLPASVFIELLEEHALIDDVGLWVIDQACRQVAQWRAQGLSLEAVAVNVSARQLHDEALPEHVAAILARHGLRPGDLELEVTETVSVGESDAPIAVLRRLRDSGVRIALDDFGTGYSSLSYLHRLPIGVLKVDRSFVSELGQRDSALALTRSIIALARALGLRVVAEGVETERQAGLLVELGCDELQGFLYSPPIDAPAFRAFVARREGRQPAPV